MSIAKDTDSPHMNPVTTLAGTTFSENTFWMTTSAIISPNDTMRNGTQNLRTDVYLPIRIAAHIPANRPANADMSLTQIGSWEPLRWNDLPDSWWQSMSPTAYTAPERGSREPHSSG